MPSAPDAPGPELHPELAALSWLVGRWRGTGAMVWPGTADRTVVVELDVSHDGRPFLAASSRSWVLAADGTHGEPGPAESGFWRKGPGPHDVELVLAHPDGAVEVLVGTVAFSKVDLVSDLVARTAQAATEVTATRRLYGGVDSDVAFVIERATPDVALQPHLSARLSPA